MVPTAAAVTASRPISAPVGTTIWPPFCLASSTRSSWSSSAPALRTTAVFPLATNGSTTDLTSLPGAHSMTISATAESASIGRTAGVLARPESQLRCFSGFCTDTATRANPSIPRSSASATRFPIGPNPAMATRKSAPALFEKSVMDWLFDPLMTTPSRPMARQRASYRSNPATKLRQRPDERLRFGGTGSNVTFHQRRHRAGPVDRGGRPRKAYPSTLHRQQRLRQFRDRRHPVGAIEHDDIGWIAGGNAVIPKPHQLCRQQRDHVQACLQFFGPSELRDIGIEVCHPQQRAIAERRKRIENVVGRKRTGDALAEQPVHKRHPAWHRMLGAATHQKQIGRR